MMPYYLFFLCASGLGYGLFVLVILKALRTVRHGVSEETPFVSVVLAARNERAGIGACLAALYLQDYGRDNFEVIIADDRSEDGTAEVVRRFQEIFGNLKIITVLLVPDGVSPKKNALTRAISSARGSIILQTDADCIVPESWITGMVKRFEEGVVLVTGVAPYIPSPGALNSFIRHEYLWNAVLSAGSIALGRGTHASGRNFGFRRDVFEQADGYGEGQKVQSGDDTLLLHRIQKRYPGGIATNPEKSTHVLTRAPGDVRSFFRQRTRHMSTGKYFDPLLIMIGGIVYGFHLLMVAALLLSPVSPRFFIVFVIAFAVKSLLDARAASAAHRILELEVTWRRFVFNELFLLFYMAFMPIAGCIVPVRWKEK